MNRTSIRESGYTEPMTAPRYRLTPVTTPLPSQGPKCSRKGSSGDNRSPQHSDGSRTFLRPANEDDDGYDPYSDRPADPEAQDVEDPWR